jgi:hypothetical protein
MGELSPTGSLRLCLAHKSRGSFPCRYRFVKRWWQDGPSRRAPSHPDRLKHQDQGATACEALLLDWQDLGRDVVSTHRLLRSSLPPSCGAPRRSGSLRCPPPRSFSLACVRSVRDGAVLGSGLRISTTPPRLTEGQALEGSAVDARLHRNGGVRRRPAHIVSVMSRPCAVSDQTIATEIVIKMIAQIGYSGSHTKLMNPYRLRAHPARDVGDVSLVRSERLRRPRSTRGSPVSHRGYDIE